MTVKLNLVVNDSPINTDYFVSGFMDHVVSGIIEALEGTAEIRELVLSIDGDKVKINLNGKDISLNTFASRIVKSTIIGMISILKGVNEIKQLKILLNK